MTPAAFREWRARLGLSQAEAARLLGVDVRTVKRYEGGHRKIPGPVEKLTAVLVADTLEP